MLCEACQAIFDSNQKASIQIQRPPPHSGTPLAHVHHITLKYLQAAAEAECQICSLLWERWITLDDQVQARILDDLRSSPSQGVRSVLQQWRYGQQFSFYHWAGAMLRRDHACGTLHFQLGRYISVEVILDLHPFNGESIVPLNATCLRSASSVQRHREEEAMPLSVGTFR